MRTLILGGTGTIGAAITAACDDRQFPHLRTSYRDTAPDTTPIDVRDADAVRELVADYQPEATIFAAPVDDLRGVQTVAEAVRATGGVLVAFSCAGVFGECKQAMREEDAVNPPCDRTRQLAAMERVVRTALPDQSVIVRTHTVFDAAPFGLVARLMHRMRRGDLVRADNDCAVIPTFAADLADVTLDLLKHGHTGTFHVVGPERHTDFTFARLVAHLFGFDADLVLPDADADGRPRRVLLDRLRVRSLLGPNALRGAAAGLRTMRKEWSEASRLPVAA